jgi:hypothetical protein
MRRCWLRDEEDTTELVVLIGHDPRQLKELSLCCVKNELEKGQCGCGIPGRRLSLCSRTWYLESGWDHGEEMKVNALKRSLELKWTRPDRLDAGVMRKHCQ